jgi:RimJ/RimL family protein N-acetyltransferase
MVTAPGEVAAETARLRLRNWRDGDEETFFRHTNTENVMRWLGGVKSREFLDGVVHERFMAWQAQLGFTFWVVERKSDGAFLGFCGLKIADAARSPVGGAVEVGWRFREDSWGQAYAKEAASAALRHAFEVVDAERVVALTVEGNKASWGLMIRLGMERRRDLDYVDPAWPDSMNPVIVYEMRKSRWAI